MDAGQCLCVVVTEASGEAGRAAALEYARRGAYLVLAARAEEPLHETAEACRLAGADEILTVPTDACDHEQIEALARRAGERYGHIDVWINAADTLVSQLHGASAALSYFRAQGTGLLINLEAPMAGAPAQATVRIFAESLRQELRGTRIKIATVLPGTSTRGAVLRRYAARGLALASVVGGAVILVRQRAAQKA